MREKLLFILLIFILGYLYLGYTRFFHYIGLQELKSPYSTKSIIIKESSQSGIFKYVALGDSLTAGVGSDNLKNTLPYIYSQKLSLKHGAIELSNLAQPGATVEWVRENQLEPAISLDPDQITLFVGINDVLQRTSDDTFKTNYMEIVRSLKTGTKSKIVLINIPYLGSSNLVWFPFNLLLDFQIKNFNNIIQAEAKSNNLQLIDLYAKTKNEFSKDPNFYSSDMFHPSGYGYILWGRLLNVD